MNRTLFVIVAVAAIVAHAAALPINPIEVVEKIAAVENLIASKGEIRHGRQWVGGNGGGRAPVSINNAQGGYATGNGYNINNALGSSQPQFSGPGQYGQQYGAGGFYG